MIPALQRGKGGKPASDRQSPAISGGNTSEITGFAPLPWLGSCPKERLQPRVWA